MKQGRNPNRRQVPVAALRMLITFVALAAVLVACSTSPAVTKAEDARKEVPAPTHATEPWNPSVVVPRGPFYSAPLHLGTIPEGEPQTWLRPLGVGDKVEMKALLISATNNAGEIEPSTGAWIALLEQTGTPYDWFVASEETLTPDRLVRGDGVGRYQAILLSTSNLVYAPAWESALDSGEWELLFNYERDYGVRQATLYGAPYSAPEDLGVGIWTPSDLDSAVLTPTAAGLTVFNDLPAGSEIDVYGSDGFPSRDPLPGTTPLLMAGDDILALLTETDGRERVTMLYNNPAWGASNTPAIYTQQIGASLLRWAMRGVHIGERRASYQADVDDWFSKTGFWDVGVGGISQDVEFEMDAQDAYSLVAQQQGLRTLGGGIAPGFTWAMAFNGDNAEPSSIIDCELPASSHTLSSMTRCLAGEFRWVNHTWSHEYMDWIPELPDPGPNYDEIITEISNSDNLATAMGLDPTNSVRSLVTGDISGLGWYAPGGPDTGPKVDFGLDHSSPYLLQAVVDSGRSYLASNMSTPSHEPDCWACGIEHPMNAAVFLVPRWPTNLFATVTTPEAVTQAYNMTYGPGGTEPIPGLTQPLSYEEILDLDTDIALVHLLSGSPYPHYFHIPNFYEYEAGRSTLYDWTAALFTKYAAVANEPLLSYTNDASGDYVRARTEFLATGVTGVWDRMTNTVTLTAANAGPVFFTGASLGSGSTDLAYNGRVISQREFSAGQSVTFSVGPAAPPVMPVIGTFAADPAAINAGQTTQLRWSVTGSATSLAVRVKGGSVVEAGLPDAGSLTVSPTATTTYELVASWTGGSDVVAEVTVAVTPAPLITSFSASPAAITVGESTQLNWTVTGTATNIALRVKDSAEIVTGLPASGNHAVNPTATTTYELVASWTGGADVIRETTVSVAPAVDPVVVMHTLTLELSGSGFGVVITSPNGAACIDECEIEVKAGTTITLAPVALLGSTFDGFTGACDGVTCTITLSADATIGARFEFKD